ncbi:hypothetical protein [Nesterenkonia pannonica]|uniref:hypothetical protein n=1 Tax=Nesterenkonia pannonica TaxID=1548602 RepID=UPI002164B7B9|nr:hypothetical protein [Nesterenkonia pannonica]
MLTSDTGLAQLITLGTAVPLLSTGSLRVRLSLRHAEILTLLAWHGDADRGRGLSSGELAEMLFGERGHEVALRAEMVRLRRALAKVSEGAGVDLLSKPYRLTSPCELDALTVRRALASGARSLALDIYGASSSPAPRPRNPHAAPSFGG